MYSNVQDSDKEDAHRDCITGISNKDAGINLSAQLPIYDALYPSRRFYLQHSLTDTAILPAGRSVYSMIMRREGTAQAAKTKQDRTEAETETQGKSEERRKKDSTQLVRVIERPESI